ncbi:unnamed protein product, partial [Diamesa serratosioi]
ENEDNLDNNELLNLKTQLEKVTQKYEKQEKEFSEVKTKLNTEMENLKIQLDKASETLQLSENAEKMNDNELINLKIQLDKAKENYENKKIEVQKLVDDKSEMENEMNDYKQQKLKEYKNLENLNTHLLSLKNNQTIEVQKLVEDKAKLQKATNIFETQKKEFIKVETKLKSDLVNLKKSTKNNEIQKIEQEKKLKSLNTELTSLKKNQTIEIQKLVEDKAKFQNATNNIFEKQKLDFIEVETKLNLELENLKTQLKKTKENYETELLNLKNNQTNEAQKLIEDKLKLQNATNYIEKEKLEFIKVKTKVNLELVNLTENNENLKIENNKLNHLNTELLILENELTIEVHKLEKKNLELEKQKLDFIGVQTKLNSELENLKKTTQNYKTELSRLRTIEVQNCVEQKKQLQSTLINCDEKNNKQNDTITKFKKSLKVKQDEINNLLEMKQLKDAKCKYSTNGYNNKLDGDMEKLKSLNQQLVKEKSELEKQINHSKTQSTSVNLICQYEGYWSQDKNYYVCNVKDLQINNAGSKIHKVIKE